MGGVLRGSLAVLVYLGGLLFYAVRFLLFGPYVLRSWPAFAGVVCWASLKFSAPGSITRGLFDAIIVLIAPALIGVLPASSAPKIRHFWGGAPQRTVRRDLRAEWSYGLSADRPGY